MEPRNVLGKGLSALIPTDAGTGRDRIQALSVVSIKASRFQPRLNFSDAKLQELVESIREKGIIQPILVRPVENGYELIAGERRLRAVKFLGLTEIPAIIKKVEDGDALEIALIENIQREELSKIEEAKAYKRLSEEFGLTHEVISKRVAKDRATISNTLRLLDLPEKIQNMIQDSILSVGHAKTILGILDPKRQMKICDDIVKRGLSVRQAETIVRLEGTGKKIMRRNAQRDPNIVSVEEQLQQRLGTRVKLIHGKKRGRILIDFYSLDDLDRLLKLLLDTP